MIRSIIKIVCIAVMACAVVPVPAQNPKNYHTLQKSGDPAYGYTPEKAIPMQARTVVKSMENAHKFVLMLRDANGEKLELLTRNRVVNPNYVRGDLTTGTPYLDEFVMRTQESGRIVRFYINPDVKGVPQIPEGFTIVQ